MTIFRFSLLAACALLAGCGRSQTSEDTPLVAAESENLNSPKPAFTEEGEPFDVESDPQAHYRLLKWTRLRGGHMESLTRRSGPSGTSFTRIEIDCLNRLYKVLGEGDAKADALKNLPYSTNWTDLVSGSIKDVTVSLVCQKVRS